MQGEFKKRFYARVAELGGISKIMERVAAGETIAAIAKDYGVARPTLSMWLGSKRDEKRRALYQAARAEAATAMAEQGLNLLDSAPETRDGITKAKAQADYRRWLATVWDRETYGENKVSPAGVTLNIGSVHVDALREFVVPKPAFLSGPARPALPAEIILEEPSEEQSDEPRGRQELQDRGVEGAPEGEGRRALSGPA